MEASAAVHAPVVLHLGKNPEYVERRGGCRSLSAELNVVGEKINLLPPQGFETSTIQPIVYSLSQLLCVDRHLFLRHLVVPVRENCLNYV